ncbi:hypothetical protein [Hydrogenophaga sp. NFH-34]|uniref:hypothetical protein n=1 Tax=Hydrogenophaga sp. NFH-34 TaxID=2744446 RepID=UPI001F2D19BE|nr:hypothetical protein [Hydrogenophaga sp. NFH-34]
MQADPWQPPSPRAAPLPRAVCLLSLTLLAACATPVAPPPAPRPAETAVAAPPAPAAQPPAPVVDLSPPPAPPPPRLDAPMPALVSALVYADRLRSLGAAELAAEQVQIGEPGNAPERLMQLALVLSQTHQAPDTARALAMLQRLMAINAPEALELRPLARLLAGRLQENRRLEEQVDRQAQQLREAQRRIDILNDRLEAMRAIERSLTPRPPARPLP